MKTGYRKLLSVALSGMLFLGLGLSATHSIEAAVAVVAADPHQAVVAAAVALVVLHQVVAAVVLAALQVVM
jgi:hypothetical protein